MLVNLEKYKNVFDNYTELRVQENRSFRAGFLNGNLITNNRTTEGGVSSRVFRDGNWGFSSNAEVSDDSINSVIRASNDNVSFLSKRYQGRCGIILPETMFNYEMNLSTDKNKNSTDYWISFLKDIDGYISTKYPELSSRRLFIPSPNFKLSVLPNL